MMQHNRMPLKCICVRDVFFSFLMPATSLHVIGSNLTLVGVLSSCRLGGVVLGSRGVVCCEGPGLGLKTYLSSSPVLFTDENKKEQF